MDDPLREFGGTEDVPIHARSLSDDKRKTSLGDAPPSYSWGEHPFSDSLRWNETHCVCGLDCRVLRSVHQIEEYIQNEVHPYYGNTHTTTSITGHQSTCFRAESRQIIAQAVNAKISGKAAEDVVIFSGKWYNFSR